MDTLSKVYGFSFYKVALFCNVVKETMRQGSSAAKRAADEMARKSGFIAKKYCDFDMHELKRDCDTLCTYVVL